VALISISGFAGSGKDTVAQIIQELQPDKQWQIKKFSGKLKEMASLITGIPVDKFEDQHFKRDGAIMIIPNTFGPDSFKKYSVRDFLQYLGTECVRDLLGKDIWVNALLKDYNASKHNWIITDCRFPNELEGIQDKGGYTLKVIRKGINAVNAHPSEIALDNYDYGFDGYIDNFGDMEDLRTEIAYQLKHL
jgi:hypothetical protein